jgi:hypothetical protein
MSDASIKVSCSWRGLTAKPGWCFILSSISRCVCSARQLMSVCAEDRTYVARLELIHDAILVDFYMLDARPLVLRQSLR